MSWILLIFCFVFCVCFFKSELGDIKLQILPDISNGPYKLITPVFLNNNIIPCLVNGTSGQFKKSILHLFCQTHF